MSHRASPPPGGPPLPPLTSFILFILSGLPLAFPHAYTLAMCIVFWATVPPSSPAAGSTSSAQPPPAYRFILLANRDEYLERPTRDMAWHDFAPGISSSSATGPQIRAEGDAAAVMDGRAHGQGRGQDDGPFLCGRDLGDPTRGTWLGVARNGRIGVLTNLHVEMGTDDLVGDNTRASGALGQPQPATTPGPSRSASPRPERSEAVQRTPRTIEKKAMSRGALIRDYLVGSQVHDRTDAPDATGAEETEPFEQAFCTGLHRGEATYNPFNLLLFDVRGIAGAPGMGSGDAAGTTGPAAGEVEAGGQARGWYYSNAGEGDARDTTFCLAPEQMAGDGMSNTPLDKPWPKVKEGRTGLARLVDEMRLFESDQGGAERDEQKVIEALMGFMGRSKAVRHRSDLPTSICVPLCEIPLPQHHATSVHLAHGAHPISSATPARADTPTHSAGVPYRAAERPYGTRLSTLVLVKGDGGVVVVERDRLRLVECEVERKVVLGGTPDRVFRFRMDG